MKTLAETTPARKPSSRKSSYNPGTPGEILSQGNGRWVVQSHRNRADWYVVEETEAGLSCTCPDHAYRGSHCKHASQVEAKLVADAILERDLNLYRVAVEKALQMAEDELSEQIRRTDLAPVVLQAAKDAYSRRYL